MLVVFAFGAGGAYALLRWLIGVAAVVCLSSCAAFQQADKFLGEAATAVSLAEPRLQVCYAAELESCKKDNTCEITEEVWKPVIDSFKAVRKTWCAILPGALGCIEE